VAGMAAPSCRASSATVAAAAAFTVLIGADGQVKKTYLGRLKFDELRKDLASL
jgi:hypothetical protein